MITLARIRATVVAIGFLVMLCGAPWVQSKDRAHKPQEDTSPASVIYRQIKDGGRYSNTWDNQNTIPALSSSMYANWRQECIWNGNEDMSFRVDGTANNVVRGTLHYDIHLRMVRGFIRHNMQVCDLSIADDSRSIDGFVDFEWQSIPAESSDHMLVIQLTRVTCSLGECTYGTEFQWSKRSFKLKLIPAGVFGVQYIRLANDDDAYWDLVRG